MADEAAVCKRDPWTNRQWSGQNPFAARRTCSLESCKTKGPLCVLVEASAGDPTAFKIIIHGDVLRSMSPLMGDVQRHDHGADFIRDGIAYWWSVSAAKKAADRVLAYLAGCS